MSLINLFNLFFVNAWSQSPVADLGSVIREGAMGRGHPVIYVGNDELLVICHPSKYWVLMSSWGQSLRLYGVWMISWGRSPSRILTNNYLCGQVFCFVSHLISWSILLTKLIILSTKTKIFACSSFCYQFLLLETSWQWK